MFYGEHKTVVFESKPGVRADWAHNRSLIMKSPATGSYALVDQVKRGKKCVLLSSDWYICREYFHAINKDRKRWLYCHRVGYSYKIASFVYDIEKKLKLKEFTEFGPTQLNRVSWINLSSFWMQGSMRRSLFTILLRAGQKYDPCEKNFLECVAGDRYLADTMFAFNRFISGYTKYTGYDTGWFSQFRWGGPPDVREVTSLSGVKMKYYIRTRTLRSQIKRLLVKSTI